MLQMSFRKIGSQVSWQLLQGSTRRLANITAVPHQQMCSNKSSPSTSVQTSAPDTASKSSGDGGRVIQPGVPTKILTISQKRYIMLAFKHKTIAEIPNELPVTRINQLYTRARITLNLMLGALTLLFCSLAIYSGKQKAAAGETLSKINRDWHKQIKEEYLAEQRAEELKKSSQN